MAKLYHQQDCDIHNLDGKTVAVIGYAVNLKESGVNVIIGLYEGSKS